MSKKKRADADLVSALGVNKEPEERNVAQEASVSFGQIPEFGPLMMMDYRHPNTTYVLLPHETVEQVKEVAACYIEHLVFIFRKSPHVWLDASALIGKAVAGRITGQEAGERVAAML